MVCNSQVLLNAISPGITKLAKRKPYTMITMLINLIKAMPTTIIALLDNIICKFLLIKAKTQEYEFLYFRI